MANNLQTWSPFRELDNLRRSFDEMFDNLLSGRWPTHPIRTMMGTRAPAIESYIENGKMIVRADLPGVDPADVDVSVSGDMLTLRAKREDSREEKDRDYFYREVGYGSFERSIELPKGVDASQIKASYKNGVLELTIPAPKELSPRKVPITIESRTEKNG